MPTCTKEEREILDRLKGIYVSGNMDVYVPDANDPRDRHIGYARNLMWYLYQGRPPVPGRD